MSHNSADKAIARKVGSHLTLVGLDVWFDEWEIQAGDSIPGKLNSGLKGFDAFILLWSANADRSDWVRSELNSAIMRSIQSGSAKIIPCILDGTPLPALIADRKWIDLRDEQEGLLELSGVLTGKKARSDRLRAIQEAIRGLDVEWSLHPMVGPLICCPRCGDEGIEGWEQTDNSNDRVYRGMRCPKCNWSEGGEM